MKLPLTLLILNAIATSALAGSSPILSRTDQSDVDVTDSLVHAVAFYTQTLAGPARRNVDNSRCCSWKNDIPKCRMRFMSPSKNEDTYRCKISRDLAANSRKNCPVFRSGGIA